MNVVYYNECSIFLYRKQKNPACAFAHVEFANVESG